MRWRVGVLRSGAENIDWTDEREGGGWQDARDEAVEALCRRAEREGAQEFRLLVGEQEAYCWPGVTEAGELDLSNVRDIMPSRYRRG
ncbi:hypothetical protein WHI96_26625 [Pseudonocardia tropica]|uniref:Uncharacterized protein n=3 Tax=Pseudonocardia TaxID=1847 RepID=A0A4Q7V2H9_PSEST|nr:hypothetical protein [Pseudonocardia sediminis]RZT88772.1 hypothetical protein EV383_5718 [Pseudonocardia sediminis]